jgi:hypothetical protein
MSTPNYTNIPAPSYIYGNSQDIHNALLANLIQETSLTSPSNFVRVVGDNLIVGTTQMSKVIIDTNLDISGNVVDDGTLTCRHMIYTISGITIANGAVIYDSYGNVSISGIIITPNRFSNLQYLDISSSLQGTINTLMMDFMMASNNIITI